MRTQFLSPRTLILGAALCLSACATPPAGPAFWVSPVSVNLQAVTANPPPPPAGDFSGTVTAVPSDDVLQIVGGGQVRTVRIAGLVLPKPGSQASDDARALLRHNLLYQQVNVVYLDGGHWNPINWFRTPPAQIYTSETGLDVRAYLYVAHLATPSVIEVRRQ